MIKQIIILASGSPRRAQLLQALNIPFEVKTSDIDEIIPNHLAPDMVAEYLAQRKAEAVLKKVKENRIILAADTIVMQQGVLYGKPADRNEAYRFIEKLQNNTHQVITGVCLQSTNKKRSFSVRSKVFFDKMTPRDINYYLDHHQYQDKAGAYGIQDWIGMRYISKIEGSYTNIMGLPTTEVCHELKNFVQNL